jgi:hypothetical protein
MVLNATGAGCRVGTKGAPLDIAALLLWIVTAVDAMKAGARVPPITHTRVAVQPGQHPLLEFMHPALGIIGLGSWIAFVATRYHAFAWVSFGVLLATIAAGLTWFTINRRHAAARAAAAPAEVLETSAAPGSAGVLVASGGRGADEDPAAMTAAEPAGRRYPPRRVLIHGSGAGLTLILAVITLLVSVHG